MPVEIVPVVDVKAETAVSKFTQIDVPMLIAIMNSLRSRPFLDPRRMNQRQSRMSKKPKSLHLHLHLLLKLRHRPLRNRSLRLMPLRSPSQRLRRSPQNLK